MRIPVRWSTAMLFSSKRDGRLHDCHLPKLAVVNSIGVFAFRRKALQPSWIFCFQANSVQTRWTSNGSPRWR